MYSKKISILILGVLAWAVICIPKYEEVALYVWNAANRPVVVVDAGHGGVDGGASGADGTLEKDVNLSIANLLKGQLEQEGVRVVMTRKDDDGLYGGSREGSIRTLKTRDMHERKRIIDEAGAALTVSIHLNSFTQDPSVKGAQVFYPAAGDVTLTEKSGVAAGMIQAALNETVNEAHPRTEMEKDDVFLFREIACPMVIAECGFLSNPAELKKLKAEEWQREIAETLKKGICEFLEKEESTVKKAEEKNNKR